MTSLLVVAGPADAGAAVAYAPGCASISAQYPTGHKYGLPILNQIVSGTLTQAASTVSNINASVCGLLQFPSLSASIPASDIHYGVATANLAGIGVGTVDITASGPSTATTSMSPAPNGGLIFTLTAETANVINIGVTLPVVGTVTAVSCNISLSATLNTAPTANSAPLTGSLATGATGTAFAPKGKVTISGLTPHTPGDVAEEAGCPVVQATLGVPTSTTATFQAPIDFYSTLSKF